MVKVMQHNCRVSQLLKARFASSVPFGSECTIFKRPSLDFVCHCESVIDVTLYRIPDSSPLS